MPARKNTEPREPGRKLPPAADPEIREQQLIALAYNLAEERLRNGTASAQEVTHLLKAGQLEQKLKLEGMRLENRLREVKTEQVGDQEAYMKLQQDAMRVFGGYSGQDMDLLDDDDED